MREKGEKEREREREREKEIVSVRGRETYSHDSGPGMEIMGAPPK